MDCIVFFDNVLVPWERVFLLYVSIASTRGAARHAFDRAFGASGRGLKNLAKCEFILGLALLMSEALGNSHLPHTEERIGELMLYTQLMRSCMRAAEADAEIDRWGVMAPAILPVESTRNLMMTAYPRMVEILQLLGSSSFLLTPSEKDMAGPLRPQIEQYLATDKIRSEGPGEAVPPGVGRRRQRLRQSAGALRAVLRQRPVDPGARDGRGLPEGPGHGAGV